MTTSRRIRSIRSAVLPVAAILTATTSAWAIDLDPLFADDYSVIDLGAVPGVPTPYGGLTLKYDDPDVLLIGGNANSAAGAIYAIGIERGCLNQVVGFVGEATLFSTAPNIDGGLAYGPENVLFYTAFPINDIGQIKPGSVVPDRVDDAGEMGVASSLGTLNFVPEGFAGAGRMKLASYNASSWYDAEVKPDGAGTFDIINVTPTVNTGGGPEGIVHISGGNPVFAADSILVSKYSSNVVHAYESDGNGDPVIATEQAFVTGLSGAEGATIDPATGEFLFSTFGGSNRVIIVRGFQDACPADISPPGGDGTVSVQDLLAVLAAWEATCVDEDVDEDGVVGIGDVLFVLGTWGACE
jgi:hypothetical protein